MEKFSNISQQPAMSALPHLSQILVYNNKNLTLVLLFTDRLSLLPESSLAADKSS